MALPRIGDCVEESQEAHQKAALQCLSGTETLVKGDSNIVRIGMM